MPLLYSLRIRVQTYWGTIFSFSVYKQTNYLLSPEANPHDEILQSIISFQLFLQEKSPKPKHGDMDLLTVDSM